MVRNVLYATLALAPVVIVLRFATDTGDVVLAEFDGEISHVDAERIVVSGGSDKAEYPLHKFMRSNQGTIIHQRPIVKSGQKVKTGDVLFKLDPVPYQLEVNNLEAQLSTTQAGQKELEESLKGARGKIDDMSRRSLGRIGAVGRYEHPQRTVHF